MMTFNPKTIRVTANDGRQIFPPETRPALIQMCVIDNTLKIRNLPGVVIVEVQKHINQPKNALEELLHQNAWRFFGGRPLSKSLLLDGCRFLENLLYEMAEREDIRIIHTNRPQEKA